MSYARQNKRWTTAERAMLTELKHEGKTELFIARVLGRPVLAVAREWLNIVNGNNTLEKA